MILALYILIALCVVGGILYLHHRHQLSVHPDDTADADSAVENQDDEECCGMHITCEHDSLLAAVSPEIEYYDDEGLDAYQGIAPDEYSEEAIEEFRNILLTLLPHDIAGWARSLQLRNIQLPTEVKEELLLIVSEARTEAAHK